MVMAPGKAISFDRGNSVTAPAVVIRPILLKYTPLLSSFSVNQRAPSGPAVMPLTTALAVGRENAVTVPDVVIRPM
jgi:hypothetical protein